MIFFFQKTIYHNLDTKQKNHHEIIQNAINTVVQFFQFKWMLKKYGYKAWCLLYEKLLLSFYDTKIKLY